MRVETPVEAGPDVVYAKALGRRLRVVRTQQRLSLGAVEEKSGGRWKAVVVGSYERGDRNLKSGTLAALAAFYGVPVVELLPDMGGRPTVRAARDSRLVWDLEALAAAAAARPVGDQPAGGLRIGAVAGYVGTVQAMRGDWGGRVLTTRGADVWALALLTGVPAGELVVRLTAAGVLASGDRLVELVGEAKAARVTPPAPRGVDDAEEAAG